MTPDTAYELERLRREVRAARWLAWTALVLAAAGAGVAGALLAAEVSNGWR